MAKKSDDKREKKDRKEKKEKKREKKDKQKKKGEESEPAASAVAKPTEPTDSNVSLVNLEEKDDPPDDLGVDFDGGDETRADGGPSHGAGPKDDNSYSYEYEESEEEGRGRSRAKEHAKYQAGKPDPGDSSDESSTPSRSPMKGARKKAQDLSRDIKAARDPAARKRSLGSAVENSHGSAVANLRKSGRGPASYSRGSAVAGVAASYHGLPASSNGSTVVSSDSARSTRPRGTAADWYTPRDSFQNLGGIGSRTSRDFRNSRLNREGNANRRDGDLHMPNSFWMVDRDCPPEEIESQIFGANAKHPHTLFICVDMEHGEQSKAHDYLCQIADEARATRDVLGAQHRKASRSGPKKTVHRLGREDDTFGFVVLHNGFVSQCLYYDFKAAHREEHDPLRFGTLQLSLLPTEDDPTEKDLCLGVTSLRRCVDTKTTFDKSDAQMLAVWTNNECHDFVVAFTGRHTCATQIWSDFGKLSQARGGHPLYQPVKKPVSAVATPSGDSSSDVCACPQFVFVYGEVTKLNMPEDCTVRPPRRTSVRTGRLLECMVEWSEIPVWERPPPKALAHRQAFGVVSIKAIDWDKAPDQVLPLTLYIDNPSKTIVNKKADKSIAKGKGQCTAKSNSQGKGNYTRTDQDERRRHMTDDKYVDHRQRTDTDRAAYLQRLQQQRMQSVGGKGRPQPPPFPPTRTQYANDADRRRSPGRVGVTSSSSRRPRTPSPSHPPPRAASHSSPPRKQASRGGLLMPISKGAPYVVRQQRDDLHHYQRVALKAPRRSPSPGVPEDDAARAAYVQARQPEFLRSYREWGDKKSARPHAEESICSDEDFIEAEEEFETDMDPVPGRVTMLPRGSNGRIPPWHANSARGQGRGRSRSPVRARATNPPAREQQRSLAHYARPQPRAQHSRSSTSVRDESPVRASQCVHRDRSPQRSSHRKHPIAPSVCVMKANEVRVSSSRWQ